jgi:hypothetical protein
VSDPVQVSENMSGICPENVRKMSGKCPESVRKMSGKCPQNVHKMSGICAPLSPENFSKFSKIPKISFSHGKHCIKKIRTFSGHFVDILLTFC